MNLVNTLLLLLPALTLASPAGEPHLQEFAEVDVLPQEAGTFAVYNLPHATATTGAIAARQTRAICPTGYPLYCAAWGFCCPSIAVGCCQFSCCGAGTTFCYNGHCYGPA